jgi:hypothetical protein
VLTTKGFKINVVGEERVRLHDKNKIKLAISFFVEKQYVLTSSLLVSTLSASTLLVSTYS